jgi:hypothetical protein
MVGEPGLRMNENIVKIMTGEQNHKTIGQVNSSSINLSLLFTRGNILEEQLLKLHKNLREENLSRA